MRLYVEESGLTLANGPSDRELKARDFESWLCDASSSTPTEAVSLRRPARIDAACACLNRLGGESSSVADHWTQIGLPRGHCEALHLLDKIWSDPGTQKRSVTLHPPCRFTSALYAFMGTQAL